VVNLRYTLHLIALLATALIGPALAQVESRKVTEEVSAAVRSVHEGRVNEGLGRLETLLREIDSGTDKDAYWQASTTLVELLSQTEQHARASEILRSITVAPGDSGYFQWMQFYLGRNLAYLGRAADGERFLRAVTAGDARFVFVPAQRAAALMLSKIELDRGNVTQSAIWMRRAVVGTLVDKGAGSEEIADVLTEYANYLVRTRRLADAFNLFARLAPLYDSTFPHRSPKYLQFMSYFLGMLTARGNFQAADQVLSALRESVSSVDIVAASVREGLFLQDLYQAARASATGEPSITDRLKQVVSSNPNILKQARTRIIFSYFALRDIELAEDFLAKHQEGEPLDAQFSGYEMILRSYIAARRNKFDESIALSRDALEKIGAFHEGFENESATRLPAITTEERAVFGLVLGMTAAHVSSFEQADAIFQLEQFLNRDKGKLGLNAKVARQELKSDLQREDRRTRDRLLDLRDRIMNETVSALLERALPVRAYAPGQKNDYTFLTRLEEIEDKIVSAEAQLHSTGSNFFKFSAERPIQLSTVQRLIRPNEAVVLHVITGQTLITTCIGSDSWTFHVRGLDHDALQQIFGDWKLVTRAMEGSEPSALDTSFFPRESAYRLYETLFGGVDACLHGKTHILLATDPDLFSIPWNALLTRVPSKDQEFRFRDAPWLPKSYALSLLPSVRSLYQLRATLPPSQAREKFLGVGAPDFKGTVEHSTLVSLAPLFTARGVANRAAIADLPSLPDAVDELRVVAEALGVSTSDTLVGGEATEREVRKRPLNDYRVISFATHAIVAGGVEGITEPALVLSPGPDETNRNNDGLLTASEIANLALDANLVILSACNTAAADGRASSRGLSGLADAFFFAGARAVAVTQWAVLSKSAKQLGAGLVTHSLASPAGVAEGLRQAMLDYISTSTEDYLAHPYFWAAFIVAGDGAVALLDGITGSVGPATGGMIQLEREEVRQDLRDLQFTDLAKVPRQRSFYATGIRMPRAGEKRGGSYSVRINPNTITEVVDRSELGALSVIVSNSDVALLGYQPSEGKTAAVFRLLGSDGQEKWQHVVDSSLSNFPVSLISSPWGYILISIETDFSPSSKSSTLVLTLVSRQGDAEMQRRYPLSIQPDEFKSKNVVLDSAGNLVIAIGGRRRTSLNSQVRQWTNPLTGSKRYCTFGERATELFSIDQRTLDVVLQRVINDGAITAIRQVDGRLYAAMGFTPNCRIERSARLVQIGSDLNIMTIFETSSINGIEITDLEITPDYFLMVGKISIFLPTSLIRKTISPQQLNEMMWDDSIWEISEDRINAFVLVVGKDGNVLTDRVFHDVRNRSISRVAKQASDRFIAVGGALGDRGWIITFSVQRGLTLWENLTSLLGRFFGWITRCPENASCSSLNPVVQAD
jgi:CHAT domain-containing protein